VTGGLRGFLRQALRMMDVEVSRYSNTTAHRRLQLLRRHSIDLVIDVGASRGQYARRLIAAGYRGRILSVEPLSSAFVVLRQAAARHPGWRAENVAIGAAEGRATLHVAGNSVSSSLLPMLEAHLLSAPESAYVAEEQVPVLTLDDLCRSVDCAGEAIFLKLDVQGGEMDALRGGPEVLRRVRALEIEMSLVPLYDGQPLLPEVASFLIDAGFVVASVADAFRDRDSERLLQVDCIWVRHERT
jgi:FkbM family methyltransferase